MTMRAVNKAKVKVSGVEHSDTFDGDIEACCELLFRWIPRRDLREYALRKMQEYHTIKCAEEMKDE